MVAPVPAQISNLPPRLHRPPHIHSLLLTTHQSLPTSPRMLTPFLLITSLQAKQFHVLAHSFAQRRAAIPFTRKSLRTLPVATGVYTPSNSKSSRYSLCLGGKSILFILLPPLSSLFALLSALASFVFNRLQPLFTKYRGWGVSGCA